MNGPFAAVVSNSGTLFVSDNGNHRVLRFNNAASKSDGADADEVFGQVDFFSSDDPSPPTASSLRAPAGLAFEETGARLYVAELGTNRILIFNNALTVVNCGCGLDADNVLGQTDFATDTPNTGGVSASTLATPLHLFFDNSANALWAADLNNSRALRYTRPAGGWTNGRAASVVLGQSNFSCSGLADATTVGTPRQAVVDPTTGKLFVSDLNNSRILRFSSANAMTNGSAAEAVFGQPDFCSDQPNRGGSVAANTLASPVGIFVDSSGRLWVADQDNDRVLRFDNASTKPSGANADAVLGKPDLTSRPAKSSVSNTKNTVKDPKSRIRIAVQGNKPVLSFPTAPSKSNDANAEHAARPAGISSSVKKPTTPSAANTLGFPLGVWVDAAGRLWVSDSDNNRVVRFDNAASKANGASADGVLGQIDFANSGNATTQNGMDLPFGIVVTNSGTLFVADEFNNRILRFDNAAAKSPGANADKVLGQTLFTTNAAPNPPTQSSLSKPLGVAYEENGGRLFVSDRDNNRVLIFNNALTKTNGANADNVLGQTDFISGTPNPGGVSASTLDTIRLPFFDNSANTLWVADRGNARVLRYTPAASTTLVSVNSSVNPSGFGQPVSFTANVNGTSGFGTPTGTVQFKVDGNNLGSAIALSNSSATSPATSSLTFGNHAITAVYNPTAGFSANTGALNGGQVVFKTATLTNISSNAPNPSVLGQPFTVNVSVGAIAPGGGTPTGSVTVSDGTVNCAITLPSDNCALTFASTGVKNLTASYSGDNNFIGSTSAVVQHSVSLGACTPTPGSGSIAAPPKRSTAPFQIFMPFLAQNFVAGPDLIVQSIVPTPNSLQIILLNQGSASVVNEFWVDLYLNPNPLPTRVNQIWPQLSSFGAVWGVTASALPLDPGKSLTLNIGDTLYSPSLSKLPATLPTGTCIFAQVDSANTLTTFGAVNENHEISANAYNNITGIQLATAVTPREASAELPRAPASNQLPIRK